MAFTKNHQSKYALDPNWKQVSVPSNRQAKRSLSNATGNATSNATMAKEVPQNTDRSSHIVVLDCAQNIT